MLVVLTSTLYHQHGHLMNTPWERCFDVSQLNVIISFLFSCRQQMGLRSSDVIILKSVLPWLHDRITTAISRFDSVPGFHVKCGDFDRQSILSESYCQNGPTLDDTSQGN